MTATTAFPFGDALQRLTVALAHVTSWAAAASILGLVVVAGIIRLMAEWQRRLTIVAIVEHAPAGTVLVQGRGLGGPELRLLIGHGSPGAVLRPPDTHQAG
jgi:hypothetical protein